MLEVSDLRIGYGQVEVVHGVSFNVKQGECVALIGPNGAGKSTLGLAAMGYTKPGCRISAGSVNFDGKELVGCPQDELRALWGSRISYVAQSASASFNPAHRLMDQVVESAVNHGVMDRAAAEADAVDLYKRLQLPNPDKIGSRFPVFGCDDLGCAEM